MFSIFILDSLYYKKPTFTPLNFLLANLSAVSLFYGANSWHYYLTQAFPILCTTTLPFVVHGILSTVFDHDSGSLRTMFGAVAWTTGVYSMARHKEWRFLHPLLPLLHVFATKSLVDLSHTMTQTKTKRKTNKPKSKPRKSLLRRCLPPIRTAYLGVLLLNIPASIFVTMFYCNAPISVMSYLRSIPQDELRNGSLGFLMPCHSTPGQAYLHRRELAQGRMWALGCEPPLG
jgi:phosphatidylinositol glycan class B